MSRFEIELPGLRPAGSSPAGLGLGAPAPADAPIELLVDLLAATRLVPPDRLALARGRARQTGSLAAALVEEGIATGEGVARMLAVRHGLPLVDLALAGVDPEAARLVPLHVLERVGAIPYALEGDVLRIAVSDPSNLHGIDELRLATRHQVELAVASRDDVYAEIRRLARSSEAFGPRAPVLELDDAPGAEAAEEETDLEVDDGVSDAPLVRLVNSVLFQAAEDGASDVHFEPQEDALLVRFRVDGVLQEVQRIPKRLAAGVTTRLKVLAKLDIAERRKPQDGRFSLNAAAAGRMLDIRVATLPTVEGESVVMRLLDKSKRPPTLQELGLSDEMRARLTRIVTRPTGALLVTGPTGSGKSTTL
ncbi:MAG: Flp pilus assembly complex ATPase component TadA, partial [Thermoleophilia bacterium]|nr:Flp pilus assembly complex ATPase component TadA [Thermoleophilia bacterium]